MSTTHAHRQGSELKVALIGTGKMGLNHVRAMRGCHSARLVAVADPQADRSQLEELLPPGVEVLTNTDELFERVRPDVVHIVTPPHTHGMLTRAALMHGAHVYVEKPFTTTRQEAEMLFAIAKERGLQLCAGHQCLFDHASIVGRKLVHEIGRIVHVESYFSFKTVRKSISPGDQAMDILPHAVYMLLDFLRSGEPIAEPVSLKGLDVSADGGVYGVLSLGNRRGILTVTLQGRPVEQWVHIIGTNGSMRVDLVSGAVVKLAGAGANIVAAMVNPYRQARQITFGSTSGFVRHLKERKYGYPGLRTLFQTFYDSIREGSTPAISSNSILETVAVCDEIGRALGDAAAQEEQQAKTSLALDEQALPPTAGDRGIVLVTGAAGFLGKLTVRELRARGWRVRGLTRRPPRFTQRVAGVEYRDCDLASGVPSELMTGVCAVVHCAAETRGGKAEQERNSIRAAEMVLEAAAAAGVRRFIHISSVAVLKPTGATLDETTPLDASLERGPYAWGKAESERLVRERGPARGVDVKVIRLGPLVDYSSYDPPGRLGRELGPWFFAVGPRKSRLALIDVGRAAAAIATAITAFDSVPPLMNLVEPEAPTRKELVSRLVANRPDLRVFWIPAWFLALSSPPLKLLQRVLLGAKKPLDIASAFATISYRTDLAAELIARTDATPARSTTAVLD